MRSMTRRERGFTLIELSIAMLIGLIGAVAVFALFVSQSTAMRQSQDSMEIQDNVRVALDMMGRDLRGAGFMLPEMRTFRVDNNCGSSGTGGTAYPGVGLAAGELSYGATTAVTANGNIAQSTQPDGCPNGSDRLAIFSRPRTDWVVNVTNATADRVDWACPGSACGPMFPRAGLTGTTCGAVTTSDPVQLCNVNDPYRCLSVKATPVTCACASTTCTLQVQHAASGVALVAADWAYLCPTCTAGSEKTSTGFNNIASRTYQLLDVDGDGSTELVVSDDAAQFLTKTAAGGNARYDVVANYVDDLQVAVAFRSAPTTFVNVNVWNFPTCTETATNVCLSSNTRTPSTAPTTNPPVAVRVALIARSAKRRITNGNVELGSRAALHDNVPVFTPYDIGAIPAAGAAYCYSGQSCGCGAGATPTEYVKCTENGNAQGFARRVVSEVIALRNL